MKKHAIFALILLWAATTGTYAGTTGVVHGYVRDERGNPIVDATVKAVSPTWVGSVHSDAQGFFAFLDLPPDTYTMSVEKNGYGPMSLPGNRVDSDQATYVALSLGRYSCGGGSAFITPTGGLPSYSLNLQKLRNFPPPFPYVQLPLFSLHRPSYVRCL